MIFRRKSRLPKHRELNVPMRIHRPTRPAGDRTAGARDLVLGAISGYEFEDIQYWVNSLCQSGYGGDRAVIAYDVGFDIVDELLLRGFHVVTFAENARRRRFYYPEKHFGHADTSIDRFYKAWMFMNQIDEAYRFAAFIDVRDVIFQTDPSAWLEQHLGEKKINVGSEGCSFRDEPWNSGALLDAYGPIVHEHMMPREIFNAGTIAGEAGAMADLALNVFMSSRHNAVPFTDQAALNILLTLEPYKSVTRFNPPEAGWACQAATTAAESAYAATHMSKRAERWPSFDGELVRTADGDPYCIVHQYDRVPAWKEKLERKYSG